MKKLMHRGSGRFPRSGASSAWIASGLACLVTALAAPSFAGGASDPGQNNGSGGVQAGGDETVGTLPIVGGRNIQLPVVEGWRGNRPAFYLEGTAADLSSTILGARGAGFVTVETADATSGSLRVAFHGDVSLVLDRDLVNVLPLHAGIAVPAGYAPGRAAIALGTGPVRTTPLRAGLLPLPVGSLSATRALDGNPLQIRTDGLGGRATLDRVYATPDVLIVRQLN